jgi:soluble lytic murein transglycosylase-like protein
MLLKRKKSEDGLSASTTVLDDLERLWRRVRALPLVAPLVLFIGLGAGNATSRTLDVPESSAVRAGGSGADYTQFAALNERLRSIRTSGSRTEGYINVYREHVEPVERVLRNRGLPQDRARRIAWPLVEHSSRTELPIETVISVMLIESGGRPKVTSPVGARGLMQIMPFWSGHWKDCGRDLYDIEANLCNGTNILDYYYDRFGGDERRALLGYNGCVRGTNTPNCFIYPDKIARVRVQIERELRNARARTTGRAASP